MNPPTKPPPPRNPTMPARVAGGAPAPAPTAITSAHREALRKLAFGVNPDRPQDVAGKLAAFIQLAQLDRHVGTAKVVQLMAEEILKHPGGPLSFAERRVAALHKHQQLGHMYDHELELAVRVTPMDGVALVTRFNFPADLMGAEKPRMEGSRLLSVPDVVQLQEQHAAHRENVALALPQAEEELQRWTRCVGPARLEPLRVARDLVAQITAALPSQ